MIHPSYSELIEAINTNNEDDDEALVLNSRYSLVLAASKRARQLIAGAACTGCSRKETAFRCH